MIRHDAIGNRIICGDIMNIYPTLQRSGTRPGKIMQVTSLFFVHYAEEIIDLLPLCSIYLISKSCLDS